MISLGLRIEMPVSGPTISIRIVLSGVVRLTLRLMFAAVASMMVSVSMFVWRFSMVMRKVSLGCIWVASWMAVSAILSCVVSTTFWIGMMRRV